MLPKWIIPVKRLVLTTKTNIWCKLPYPRHPKGCPNYGKKAHCPPDSLNIKEVLNLKKPIYIVYNEFDLAAHMKRMSRLHPNWSEAMLRNVYYWQNKSRAQLKTRISTAMILLNTNVHIANAEAMGVNLYATCFVNGLKLERIKTLKTCRHVALIGWRKKGAAL